VAREIYGVVGCYWASLVGIGRQELSIGRRALGLAFSVVTLPGEITPLVVAILDKRGEAQRVSQYARELYPDTAVARDTHTERSAADAAVPVRRAPEQA
jgi:hypothetical protein